VILPAHRLALAVGEAHEARLLALLEDPAFQVAGRGCAVTNFCSTIRELREALGRTESVDAVVMSSTLQAVPPATLRELVQIGRPLVLLVPDPMAAHWAEVPVPVLGLDTEGAPLAAALGDALLGHRSARARRHAPTARPGRPDLGVTPPLDESQRSERCEVITVSSAETPDGRTSAVAVPLAYALSYAAPTVLLDVNSRGSGVEFHLDHIDPARGLPELGRRMHPTGDDRRTPPETEEFWNAALESELQPRAPGRQPLGSISELEAWLDQGPLLMDGARWFGEGHWFIAIAYDKNGVYIRDSSGWDNRYLTWSRLYGEVGFSG
jgi:hypothetical protein